MLIFFLLLVSGTSAAFSAVSHEWLFRALRASGALEGLTNVIQGLHDMSSCIIEGSEMSFLRWVSSGVLQGCPLFGLLFVFILDPLRRAFEAFNVDEDVEGHITHACADDIGASMLLVLSLPMFFQSFRQVPIG